MEFEFNTDNTQIGFRLDYMELINWGTFHQKIWRIVPGGNNALVTGSIGSGKSTVVDALTTLLVPHHKIQFNKAAGAENKERSLVSYIKGFYKHEKDEANLKEKAVSLRYAEGMEPTFSVILANFTNQGYGQSITLAQVFWIKDHKAQKLLLISKRPLTIKNDFSKFSDIAELKRKLKTDPLTELFDDNFTQYSQQFRRLFGMNSEKAIDLFYQTVSMKSVSSLTTFVREQMLEKTDVHQQIEDLRKRFSDLSLAHEAIVSLREQKEILDPISGLATQQQQIKTGLEEIDTLLRAMPGFFAARKLLLLDAELKSCGVKMLQLTNQVDALKADLDREREAEIQVRQDIGQNGGRRLEELERLIAEREKVKVQKRKKYSQYDELTTVCDLPSAGADRTFYSNLQRAAVRITECDKGLDDLETQRVEKKIALRTITAGIQADETELESLNSRKTQIPAEMIGIRSQIMEDLDIAQDQLPFIGELLKVREEDKDWQGAIERMLHGFGLSMIVPEALYKQVSQYVNGRQLQMLGSAGLKAKGQRLEYYKVVSQKYKLINEPDADSVVRKLQIKPDSAFEEWLENELNKRFNIRCVPMEEFQRQRDVITIEGQLKTGDSRHVKDDRRPLWDRRQFVLGWTNVEKIKAIEESLSRYRKQEKELDIELSGIETEHSNTRLLLQKFRELSAYTDWAEVNWQAEAKEIEALKLEQQELQASNDVLNSLKIRLQAILAERDRLDILRMELEQQRGGLRKSIEDYTTEQQTCQQVAEQCNQEEVKASSPAIIELLSHELSLRNIDGQAQQIARSFTDRDGEKDKLQRQLRSVESKISGQMQHYKSAFPAEASELSTSPEGLPEYLKKAEAIIRQDLPRHERRFKELLNVNTIRDISVFDNKLESHLKDIEGKILKINGHLKDIEYSAGTFIRIESDRNTDIEIKRFRDDLKACYANTLGDQDAYNEDRFIKVKKLLDRFNGQSNVEMEWTNKVTDVRNWFLFNAGEYYLSDGSLKEFYAGSGGKSGGQKEKLAYTILASALAYQFGLTYGEPKSKSFRFVVIDEAFGRGDDDSTRFGLGLFSKLNLQLLIVTPLQKIHVIENHVNAVHYVSNREGNYSEIQNLTVEEYKAEKLKNQLIRQMQ